MRDAAPPLQPGLYLVATPIGSARDITLRALDILAAADVIAAEDTRTARKLMEIHGIALGGRPLWPYHDHSDARARERIAAAVAGGQAVAYVSEAGTPLIADPGYALVQTLAEAELPVTAAPGASACLAALSVAGLPTDRFLFCGFLPVKAGARDAALAARAEETATQVYYESAKRMGRTLDAMIAAFGDARESALCRELTKRFEQTMRGPLAALRDSLGSDIPLKGEFVIVIGGAVRGDVSEATIDAAMEAALARGSLKDAAQEVAAELGIARRRAYDRGLVLKNAGELGEN